MSFHADLHIHSKYSRATSRDLDLEHLFWWAARKGVRVVGTGDCVHPAWLAEIKDKLVAEGNGLFRLKAEIEAALLETLPPACRQPVSFMLCTEISTIYKKGEKTRKIHHLIYAADLSSADRLAARLARVGNIASDGRPILGLDSRDLLEIALESGPDSYLVPAHIWTPWFAALGSQSGFDSIEECYRDLAGQIFAVETGLSSDPAMNWRLSSLDRFRLTSNSDAHSPGKIGREATRFSCEPGYAAIRAALETGAGYEGTVEFFPEEGKYHLDGHRACHARLSPRETIALGGRCPACGKPVTVGVAHRVELLADRGEDALPPPTAGTVTSLVALPQILAEIAGSGAGSKTVAAAYGRLGAALGPELSMLGEVPVEDIARVHPLVGEAVARLRAGAVTRLAGYDGEYGTISLFAPGELDRMSRGALLFDAPATPLDRQPRARKKATEQVLDETAPAAAAPTASGHGGVLAALDADQAQAAAAPAQPALMVVAGPGSGKTRMLTHRIAHLVLERGVPAAACLAVTFTRKATEELRTRLAALIGPASSDIAVHSFHSLGLAILRADGARIGLRPDFAIADERERRAALAAALGVPESRAGRLLKAVSVLKRGGAAGGREEQEAREALDRIGRERNFVDYDDLVGLAVALLEGFADVAARWSERFRHIVADEFQDIDEQQYRLLRLLAGGSASLCAIGDPDQAIYGFRGADAACFARLAADFAGARTLRLGRNYRSSGTIVRAASGLIGAPGGGATRAEGAPVAIHCAADETAEAEFVAATIETLLGGHDLLAANRGGAAGRAGRPLGFGDCAVLYRTDAQAAPLRAALDRAGIPFAKSAPAPLAGHRGVAAIMRALRTGARGLDIAAAAQAAREDAEVDAAALAQAKAWLETLAASPAVAGDRARLAEAVALSTEADFFDARADRVSLLTMHAAKGLEFPIVFVTGMEDGLMPLSFGSAPAETQAEERRLLYVAMTRAMDRLFLTRAARRFRRGAARSLPASPFLSAIPAALTTAQPPRRQAAKPRQLSLF